MSLAPISSNLASAALSQTLNQTASVQRTTSTDADTATSSESPGKLVKELGQLLKDLASNNAGDAKADLSKLQQDLTAGASSGSGDSQLGKVLNQLSASLNTNSDTSDAFSKFTNYLVENGQSVGSLFSTTA